jgi:AP-1 complex subunit beta-1
MSGLEGLAGTPQRVASPAASQRTAAPNTMDDLMGVFGNGGGSSGVGASTGGFASSAMDADMMNGFASLDLMGGQSQAPVQQPQPQGQAKKNANEDILGLF